MIARRAGFCLMMLLLSAAAARGGGMRLIAGQRDGLPQLAPGEPASRPAATTAPAPLTVTGTAALSAGPIDLPAGDKAAVEDVLWIETSAENFALADGWLGGIELLAFAEGGPGLRIRCGPRRADASLEYLDPAGTWVDTGYKVPADRRIRLRTVLRPAQGRMELYALDDPKLDEFPVLASAGCPAIAARQVHRVLRSSGIRFAVRVLDWQLWDCSNTSQVSWTGSAMLPRLRIEMTDGLPAGSARLRRSGAEAYAVLPTYPGFDDREGFSPANWPHLTAPVPEGQPMKLAGVVSDGVRPARWFDVPLGDFRTEMRFRIPADLPATHLVYLLRFGPKPESMPVGPCLTAQPMAGKSGFFRIASAVGTDRAEPWGVELPCGKWITLVAEVKPLQNRFTYTVAVEDGRPQPGHGGKPLAFYGDVPFSGAAIAWQPWCTLGHAPSAPPVKVTGKTVALCPEAVTMLTDRKIPEYNVRTLMAAAGGRVVNVVPGFLLDTDGELKDPRLHPLPDGCESVEGLCHDPVERCWWLAGNKSKILYRLDESFGVTSRIGIADMGFNVYYGAAMAADADHLYFLHHPDGLLVTDRKLQAIDSYELAWRQTVFTGLAVYGDWFFTYAGRTLSVYSRRARKFFATIDLPAMNVSGSAAPFAKLAVDGDTLYLGYGNFGHMMVVDLKQLGRLGTDAEYLQVQRMAVRLTQPRADRVLLDGAKAEPGWSGLPGVSAADGDVPAGRVLTAAKFAQAPAIAYVGPYAGQVRTLNLRLARATPLACLTLNVGRQDGTMDAATFLVLVDPIHLAAGTPPRVRLSAADLFRRRQHLVSTETLSLGRYEPAGIDRDAQGLLIAADPAADVPIDLIDDLKIQRGALPDMLQLRTLLGTARLLSAAIASDAELAAGRFQGSVEGPVLDLGPGIAELMDAQWIPPAVGAARGEAAVQVRFAADRFALPAEPWQALGRGRPATGPAAPAVGRFCQWRVRLEGKDPYVTPAMGDIGLQFRRDETPAAAAAAAGFRFDPKLWILIPAVLALGAVFALCIRGLLRTRRARSTQSDAATP